MLLKPDKKQKTIYITDIPILSKRCQIKIMRLAKNKSKTNCLKLGLKAFKAVLLCRLNKSTPTQ